MLDELGPLIRLTNPRAIVATNYVDKSIGNNAPLMPEDTFQAMRSLLGGQSVTVWLRLLHGAPDLPIPKVSYVAFSTDFVAQRRNV